MKSINGILTLMFLILSNTLLIGQQKIYFCSDYTSDAEPIGAHSTWAITPTGANVKILYHNGKSLINTSVLNLYIDKQLKGRKYSKYYSTWLIPDKTKNWAIFEYKFTEPGIFRIKVTDEDNNEQASESINIQTKENLTNIAGLDPVMVSDKISSENYNDANVIFCEGVNPEDGSAVSAASVFKYYKGLTNKYILIRNNDTFKTNLINVKIYEGPYYNNFIETLRIAVKPNKNWTEFQYSFNNAGNYKFVISDENMVHIATGYVTLIKQQIVNR